MTATKAIAIISLWVLTSTSPILVSNFKKSKLNFTSKIFGLYHKQISSPDIAIIIAYINKSVATPFTHLNVKAPEKNRKRSIKKEKLLKKKKKKLINIKMIFALNHWTNLGIVIFFYYFYFFF